MVPSNHMNPYKQRTSGWNQRLWEKSERFNVWGGTWCTSTGGGHRESMRKKCAKSLKVKTAPITFPADSQQEGGNFSSPVSTNSLSEMGSRFFPEALGKEGCPADITIPPLWGWKDPAPSPWTCDWQQNCVIIKCCWKPRSLWGFVMRTQWTHAPLVGWCRASSSKRGSQRSLNLSRSLWGKNTKMSLACFTGMTFALMVQKPWSVRLLESPLPFRRWHRGSFISHCHSLTGKDLQCHLRVFLVEQNNYTCY